MNRSFKRPQGHCQHGKSKTIAVRFSEKLFERIADEAKANGRSFSSQVRVYVGFAIGAGQQKDQAKP